MEPFLGLRKPNWTIFKLKCSLIAAKFAPFH